MEEVKAKKNNKRLVIIGVLAAGLLIYGVNSYISGKGFETTDNAQLDGDLLPVRAGISGYVVEIRFKDNQHVKKGDTLIIFNTIELQAGLHKAEAELANAKANVLVSGSMAEASVQNAKASSLNTDSQQQEVNSAKSTYDKAMQDYNRAIELLQIKAVTQNNFEEIQTRKEVAKSSWLKARTLQQSSTSTAFGYKTRAQADQKQIAVTKTVIQQKQAELEVVKEQLRHAFIIASFDGIVTKRSIQTGQYITIGQSLCALINTKNLWITANFKETQLNKLKTGQKVEITVDAYTGLKLQGTIDSYGGATGSRFALIPPDNATGNYIKIAQRFPLRINLENQASISEKLYPGLSAVVKVKIN